MGPWVTWISGTAGGFVGGGPSRSPARDELARAPAGARPGAGSRPQTTVKEARVASSTAVTDRASSSECSGESVRPSSTNAASAVAS